MNAKEAPVLYAYCLFCLTQRCAAIRRLLSLYGDYEVLQPRIVQRKWVKGQAHQEMHDYLPGYLFVYTSEPIASTHEICSLDGVVRFLQPERIGGEPRVEPLSGADLAFADMLYRCNGVIDTVRVYREGDRLRLASGMLEGMEGEILRVDNHRKRLEMRFTFDRVSRRVWVGFDEVELKNDTSAP